MKTGENQTIIQSITHIIKYNICHSKQILCYLLIQSFILPIQMTSLSLSQVMGLSPDVDGSWTPTRISTIPWSCSICVKPTRSPFPSYITGPYDIDELQIIALTYGNVIPIECEDFMCVLEAIYKDIFQST